MNNDMNQPDRSNPTAPAPHLVVIGVSTGGPAALATLLGHMPAAFPVPILIVQHMPPTFTHLLADRLDKSCALPVTEATNECIAEPGSVYIAPGTHHLRATRQMLNIQLTLDEGPPENSCRPAVDVLFRSAATAFGNRVVAVVLTGMGRDGLEGTREIKRFGGRVLVQDEATSVVWGMPGEVVAAGQADLVLPLDQLAMELMRMTALQQRSPSDMRTQTSPQPLPAS